MAQYTAWKKYEMDAGEAFVAQAARPKEIDAFIKDAYGMPYIPGSSIKGMIRTALIAWEIRKDPENIQRIERKLQRVPENGRIEKCVFPKRQAHWSSRSFIH